MGHAYWNVAGKAWGGKVRQGRHGMAGLDRPRRVKARQARQG